LQPLDYFLRQTGNYPVFVRGVIKAVPDAYHTGNRHPAETVLLFHNHHFSAKAGGSNRSKHAGTTATDYTNAGFADDWNLTSRDDYFMHN
jgi:hypothetical protein